MEDVLNTGVLVLNKYYSPINITSVKRAFSLLFNKIAEVITVEEEIYNNYDFYSWAEVSELKNRHDDELDYDWVKTPNLNLIAPRVMRLLKYDKVREYKVKLTRRNIYYRDNNICQYCGKVFKTKDLNIDHIIPRSKGGRDTWHNLVCACTNCNIRKGNKLPHDAGMTLIREPIRPQLNPLIKIYVGKKKYASWKTFLDEAYWNVELKN